MEIRQVYQCWHVAGGVKGRSGELFYDHSQYVCEYAAALCQKPQTADRTEKAAATKIYLAFYHTSVISKRCMILPTSCSAMVCLLAAGQGVSVREVIRVTVL